MNYYLFSFRFLGADGQKGEMGIEGTINRHGILITLTLFRLEHYTVNLLILFYVQVQPD